MPERYADVIIDISHKDIDRAFQYRVPEELASLISEGTAVTIPFGRSSRLIGGYVIGMSSTPKWDTGLIKDIKEVRGRSLPIEGKLIKLAAWMHNSYGSTMINCLKTVMPVKEKIAKKKARLDMQSFSLPSLPVGDLTDTQREIVSDFCTDYDNGKRPVYLLHGITGSGKTEVYIRAVKKVLESGSSAIVLVPEIALTFQMVSRFKNIFGDRISIINSKMSSGEKYREFEKAKSGETSVMIGPRSALFAPFENVGLIIVDEEHDGAYKNENVPRFHAVETAEERARIEGASLILGSATPSVGSYYKAQQGIYKLWEMPERAGGASIPDIEVADMREELKLGNRSILSAALRKRMEDALSLGEQTMLFMNRRGYNSFISCRSCGDVIKCPNCDVALSVHENGDSGNLMMCHYCGYTAAVPAKCPSCASSMIAGFGTGTQKVEREVKRLFPSARVLRMDKDTTKSKDGHARILKAFAEGEADILIGTQMIVKGHDFPNVTVVGAVLADMGLFSDDYQAAERTFDLLVQAAGRAGRAGRKGNVVIQTYKPEHYAIEAAAAQDYKRFYSMEISYRKILRYPPVYIMMGVLITSGDEEMLERAAQSLGSAARDMVISFNEAAAGISAESAVIIGPGDAVISRINNICRKAIYIKSPERRLLTEIEHKLQECADSEYPDTDLQVTVDYNPLSML